MSSPTEEEFSLESSCDINNNVEKSFNPYKKYELLCIFCRKDITLNYDHIIQKFQGQKILVNKIINRQKIPVVIDLTIENTINEYHYDVNDKINNCGCHIHGNIKDHLNITISSNKSRLLAFDLSDVKLF